MKKVETFGGVVSILKLRFLTVLFRLFTLSLAYTVKLYIPSLKVDKVCSRVKKPCDLETVTFVSLPLLLVKPNRTYGTEVKLSFTVAFICKTPALVKLAAYGLLAFITN